MNSMNCHLSLLLLAAVAVSAAQANVIKRPFAWQSLVSNGNGGKLGIYDGTNTTIQKYPYMVSLSFDGDDFGAGTILSNTYVLTTADIVTQVRVSGLSVVAGSTTNDGKKIAVDSVIAHPDFGSKLYDYDFAILKLAKKLTFSTKIKAITLPSKNPAANTAMNVTGWGDTSDGESGTPMLQGTMMWLAKKTCKKIYTSWGDKWTNRMACAYNKGKTTLCENDYGDPFVSDGVIYGMFINGLASGFCSSSAEPVLLADVHSVVEWIKETISTE